VSRRSPPMPEQPERSMTRLYAGALVVETIIIVLLWLFGRLYA
jgi:hypothetical protein